MISDKYDFFLFEIISNSHWVHIENQNIGSKMWDEPGYDNSVKYGIIYDVIISKFNYVTDQDSIDQCGEETTWDQNVWDLPVIYLLTIFMGNPDITHSRKLLIVINVHYKSYVKPHKVHVNPPYFYRGFQSKHTQ